MIGRRIIKTALAAAITMVVARLLRLEYPFYAVIAVIVVMQSTLGSSLEAGINRLLGTVIGAVIGALMAISLGSTPWGLGLGLLVTIFLCNYFGLGEAIGIAGIVLTAVVLEQAERPWLFAWGRFLDTMVGIFVAWLVNALLWTPRPERVIAANLAGILQEQARYLQEMARSEVSQEKLAQYRNGLGEKIRLGRRFYQDSRGELEPGLLGDDLWQIRFEAVENIYHQLLLLEQLRKEGLESRMITALGRAMAGAAAAIASGQRPGLAELRSLMAADLNHSDDQERAVKDLVSSLLRQIAAELQKL